MIAMRSSVDCLAPFGACAHTERLVAAAAATEAALIRNSRRCIPRSLFSDPGSRIPDPDLLLLRQRERNGARRRVWSGRLLRTGSASTAAAASATLVRHDHEVLAALRLVADRNAARGSIQSASPQYFARVFIVRAHL